MSETGEKKYYCFCGSNCKYETMTKEQILTAIAQATGNANVDPDAGFISKVKETNGRFVTFWVGTQEQYNALQVKEENCLHIITDDTTKEDFMRAAAELQETCNNAAASAANAAASAVTAASAAGEAAVSAANDAATAQTAAEQAIAHNPTFEKGKGYIKRYSNGFVECAYRFKLTGVAITQQYGGLYSTAQNYACQYPDWMKDKVPPNKVVYCDIYPCKTSDNSVQVSLFHMGFAPVDVYPNYTRYFKITCGKNVDSVDIVFQVHMCWTEGDAIWEDE